MSDGSTDSTPERPKFTRGEKCIFIHIVVTFSLLLLLIIIYFAHLCVVKHSLYDVLKMTRRTATIDVYVPDVDNLPVGMVYLNGTWPRGVCNSLLLKQQWSVAPGHCVAMRTDPDMYEWLRLWRVKYRGPGGIIALHTPLETSIKRTIPHPHFDREDFTNNVGLIEHEDPVERSYFIFPPYNEINDDLLELHSRKLMLVGWSLKTVYLRGEPENLQTFQVSPILNDQCIQFMEPIVDLRSYEYCVVVDEKDEEFYPEHGSVFIMNSTMVGIFGWGEKTGIGAPSIILDLGYFKNWIINIIAW